MWDIYLHNETSELGVLHRGEPSIGDKGNFRAAMEIKADKFSPDMKLVLETPDGDFTVEAQDWTKPSERYADTPLVEDGACLAGEKL